MKSQTLTPEKLKAKAKTEIKDNFARIWFRNKYNLPPTDERYLSMTDEGILEEYYIDKAFNQGGVIVMPHCIECGVVDNPAPGTANLCPECGAEMTMPASDQTAFSDDNFPATVREELGIDYPG